MPNINDNTDKLNSLLATAKNLPIKTSASYDEFWDNFQLNGNRTYYKYGFAGHGWTQNTFEPKYDIIISTSGSSAFAESKINIDLASTLEGRNIRLDTSGCTNAGYLFYLTRFTRLPKIDLTGHSSTLSYVFGYNTYLKTIDELVLKNDGSQKFSNIFNNSTALENIVITGVIGQNGFDVTSCTKLTVDSLLSIFNALQDKTGISGTWTVSIGDNNIAKLTDEQLSIASNKNWVVN